MLISNAYNKQSLENMAQVFTKPLIVCCLLELYRKDYIQIMKVWTRCLFICVMIDAITMVLYPGGMYSDSLYSLYWFLGYKTARLVMELPLCIFTAYLSNRRYGKFGFRTYFVILISIAALFKAEAVAAGVSMLVAGAVFVVIDRSKKSQFVQQVIRGVLDYRFFILLYSFVLISTITVDQNKWLQDFFVNVLHKSPTLSTRTIIWGMCLPLILDKPLIGYGWLSSKEYIELFSNPFATSPHNMIIEIIMTVGIVGLLAYILLYVFALKRRNGNQRNHFVIATGIIIMAIVGITSTSLVFSEIGFLFFEILGVEDLIRKESNEQWLERT